MSLQPPRQGMMKPVQAGDQRSRQRPSSNRDDGRATIHGPGHAPACLPARCATFVGNRMVGRHQPVVSGTRISELSRKETGDRRLPNIDEVPLWGKSVPSRSVDRCTSRRAMLIENNRRTSSSRAPTPHTRAMIGSHTGAAKAVLASSLAVDSAESRSFRRDHIGRDTCRR